MNRLGLLSGAIVVASLSLAGIGRADTMSYADAVTALAKDCGADIKKVCKGLNLGNNQIQDCRQKNEAKVSPTCTSTLGQVTASIQQRQAAQTGFFKICAHDAAQYCGGVKGEGNILASVEVETRRQRQMQPGDHRCGMAIDPNLGERSCLFVNCARD